MNTTIGIILTVVGIIIVGIIRCTIDEDSLGFIWSALFVIGLVFEGIGIALLFYDDLYAWWMELTIFDLPFLDDLMKKILCHLMTILMLLWLLALTVLFMSLIIFELPIVWICNKFAKKNIHKKKKQIAYVTIKTKNLGDIILRIDNKRNIIKNENNIIIEKPYGRFYVHIEYDAGMKIGKLAKIVDYTFDNLDEIYERYSYYFIFKW